MARLKRFGEIVLNRRDEQLGFTQLDVHGRGGPSNSTLTKIENGEPPKPTAATLKKLDYALDWEPGSAVSALKGGEPTPLTYVTQPDREPESRRTNASPGGREHTQLVSPQPIPGGFTKYVHSFESISPDGTSSRVVVEASGSLMDELVAQGFQTTALAWATEAILELRRRVRDGKPIGHPRSTIDWGDDPASLDTLRRGIRIYQHENKLSDSESSELLSELVADEWRSEFSALGADEALIAAAGKDVLDAVGYSLDSLPVEANAGHVNRLLRAYLREATPPTDPAPPTQDSQGLAAHNQPDGAPDLGVPPHPEEGSQVTDDG